MGVRDRWKGFAELPDEVERSLRDLDELFARSGVQLAYLFGSLGRGESSHDVDLALLGGPKPVFELRQAIAERLGTQRLDLVDLADAPRCSGSRLSEPGALSLWPTKPSSMPSSWQRSTSTGTHSP